MHRSQTAEQSAGSGQSTSGQSTSANHMRLSGSRLLVTRAAWLALVVPSMGLLVAGFPLYYQQLQRPCVDAVTCNVVGALTATGLRALPAYGFSAGSYAAFNTVFWALIAAIWCGTGFLLFWRRSDDGLALLGAFFLVMFIATYPGLPTSALVLAYPALAGPAALLSVLGQVSLGAFFVLFPTGRLAPRWMGAILLLLAIQAVAPLLPPTAPLNQQNWPGWVSALLAFTTYGATIGSQVYRYRRVATPVQRQQIKWVVGSIIAVAAGFLILGLVFTGLLPQAQGSDSPASLLTLVYPLLTLLLPVSVGIAILRYRLWDIDLIINRTLVYGTLTVIIIAFYVLLVGFVGALVSTDGVGRGNLAISLVATGLIAVLFQPMRALLQRGANRLLYGQRDEPYAVITQLSQRLKGTLEPEAVLSTIVDTVAQALKLPYVSILWKREGTLEQAASYGTRAGETLTLPLVYQAETIGQLQLAPRAPGEAFTPADLRLLDELARQAGFAAHAVQLATDLQKARQRLVLAHEEERRRLRRDLHDGVGPTLASLSQRIDTASHLVRQDADAAVALLGNLKTQVRTTIADIRRVVYALRPPVLDELGLVSAIREQALRLQEENGLQVDVEEPNKLPVLPAAVEVAAYRIALEALTNVTRHAHAKHCLILLEVADEHTLSLVIRDDGHGLANDFRAGVGIIAMRERAAELGGVCTISREPVSGTCVHARLPLQG